ncbi:MAG: type II toxin-antitoxin system HicB family antitoxin [Eubacterium sp.]|nr:type II toxin-antitoxin system HicB family antitoxin [Eubacterium sp.]
MKIYNYTYQLHWCEKENMYIVHVVELPNICNDGKTADEAILNVQEDIKLALELLKEMGKEIPKTLGNTIVV